MLDLTKNYRNDIMSGYFTLRYKNSFKEYFSIQGNKLFKQILSKMVNILFNLQPKNIQNIEKKHRQNLPIYKWALK